MPQLDPTEASEAHAQPERALIVAAIQMSVDDLTNPDKNIRDAAKSFWSAEVGDTARHRRELLSLIDIDDTLARKRIAHLLTADPRKPRFTRVNVVPQFQTLLDALPDGEFTRGQLDTLEHGFHQNQINSAFQRLKDKDLVRVTTKKRGGALYAKTSWIMNAVFRESA